MPIGSDLQQNKPNAGFNPPSGFLYQAKRAIQSTAGIVEKAVLEIADFSPKEVVEKDAAKPKGGNTGLGGKFDTDLAAQVAGKLNSAKKLAKKGGEVMEGDDAKDFEIVKKSKKLKFEVPFNPAELSFTGYGGEQVAQQNFVGSKRDPNKGINGMQKVASHIEMNIPLLFDKTNPLDAFYADKFNMSGTNVVKGVATGISNLVDAKGKDKNAAGAHSVQPEVEALTYICRSDDKRLIGFTWGDMHFEGILNSVNCEYTMFNVNGEPCRATVNLRIVLMDANYSETIRIWKKKYLKHFGYDASNAIIGQMGALGSNLGLH